MTQRKHHGRSSGPSRPEAPSHGKGRDDRRPPKPEARPEAVKRRPEEVYAPGADRPRRPDVARAGAKGPRGTWLYGLHAVKAALDNPRRKIQRLLLSDEAAQEIAGNRSNIKQMYPHAVAEAATRETITQILPAGAVHQGAALLADPLSDIALEDVLEELVGRDNAVILILDQVTDPQNVGAILRSAAAFNVEAVIVPDRHSPPETAAMAKAASGAIEIVPLVRVVNLARALEQLKQAGFWVAGMAGEATQTLAAARLTGKIALVLGAEGEGLRRLTRDHCDILVRLPISSRMESLNVSAAAAVALYELVRNVK